MDLKNFCIGFGITGSYCTVEKVFSVIQNLVDLKAHVIPVFSNSLENANTRFGCSEEWKDRIETITGEKTLNSIVEVEPLGPQNALDVMVIAPCTGNTMAKLARGITDNAVLMCAKLAFRNQKPVIVAISTNDGLGINAISLGYLLNYKNLYLVPFGQDDPFRKPNSLIANMEDLIPTLISALNNKQMQPLLKS